MSSTIDGVLRFLQDDTEYNPKDPVHVTQINNALQEYGANLGILQSFVKNEPSLILPMIQSADGHNVKATLNHYSGLEDLWLNSVGAAELNVQQFMQDNTDNKYAAFVIQSSGDQLDIYAIPQSSLTDYQFINMFHDFNPAGYQTKKMQTTINLLNEKTSHDNAFKILAGVNVCLKMKVTLMLHNIALKGHFEHGHNKNPDIHRLVAPWGGWQHAMNEHPYFIVVNGNEGPYICESDGGEDPMPIGYQRKAGV